MLPVVQRARENRLDAHCYELVLCHAKHKVNDPSPQEYRGTSLWNELEVTPHDDPEGYVARIVSMLPKQLSLESSLHLLEDHEIDNLLAQLKERALEARREPPSPLLLEAPRISNGRDQSQ